jgi:cephalosporin-C deacetylase-like acetyl esterase
MKPAMKTCLRISVFLIFLLTVIVSTQAQSFILKQTHENGVYKSNEKFRITLVVKQKSDDSLSVKVWKNNDQLIFKKSILPNQDSLVIYENAVKEPCSVMLEAKQKGTRKLIGLVVAPGKLKPGSPFPKDFEAYWNQEKQNLNALLMEVKTKKMDVSEAGYECQDVEINCTGPKPARGYFAKPVGAKVRSLPIVLIVHAAGVKGSWCRSEVANAVNYAKKGNGALCFDLNAHGMLNGQPDDYYSNLEAGELKDYYNIGLENRSELYFRGMYLRLIRTLEFLTRQPEWDKKRILVIGESQGGGQALAAAGLDNRVSAVVATVPAMCDWGGTLVGRKGGWPQPFERKFDMEKMKQTLPYFDTANLLRNSKATIVVEIGLVDQTCPSTSIYAAINQAKGNKVIYPVSYREHSWPTAEQRKNWDPMVFNPKNEFVDNYLK